MKNKGSITVYLSIIIMSVILFVNVVAESARIKTVQSKSEIFTDMAAESVLAGYARQVYEDYGILLVWGKQSVEEQLEEYIQANINRADLNCKGTNFMNTRLLNVEIEKPEYVTDKGGELFLQQIISYMKYAGTIKAADKLISEYKEYTAAGKSQQPKCMDVAYIVDSAVEELSDVTENINKEIIELKDTLKIERMLSVASQELEKLKDSVLLNNSSVINKHVKKFSGKYSKLIKALDKEAGVVKAAIILIKQYELKKEQFLKKSGYISGAGDYLDEDLKILENVENRINEIKRLTVSEFSDIDSNKLDMADEELGKIKNVIENLQSLKMVEKSEQDEKPRSILEKVKIFLENGIVSLVIDDVSNISDISISDSNLPTKIEKEQIKNSIADEIKNKTAAMLYADMKFGNYLNSKKEDVLKYELEYILNGKTNDKENLTKTVEKLIASRNLINLAYLVTDNAKMGEISLLAASASAALGIPFLEIIIKGVLIETWALAESVEDVKELFKGGKVELVKTSVNWKTDLESLSGSGYSKSEKGLDYTLYLQLMIMLQKSQDCIYRIMDLIQINIQNKYNKDFLMSESLYKFEVKADFEVQPLFSAIPLALNIIGSDSETYSYTVKCAKEY